MAEVVLKNVYKQYENGVYAAKDVNLEIRDKEFMVLVGPSGCGKSTTLRMVAGLEAITSGDLYIDGIKMNDVHPKDRDIAMVFQNYALYPHMNVYENLAFGLKLRKFSKDEIHQRVMEAAEILGLTDYLDRKPKAMSGGQRQRVAVGRAIVRKPKVFLFDEPLSNLDAKMRVQMRTEISKLHKKLDATMIYVTHDQVEAMTMGDRITVMKDGVVNQIDTPLNLYNHPINKFVAGFIGSPSMNFMNGSLVQKAHLTFVEEGSGLELEIPDQYHSALDGYMNRPLVLGIRPEDIHLSGDKAANDATSTILVEVVEPMGNEIFIYFNSSSSGKGGTSLVCRTNLRTIPRTGDMMPVGFDMEKLHFFEQESGLAIR